MNTFLRPALYNAEHKIGTIDSSSASNLKYTLAGPICESSDILSKDIMLPKQFIGDHIIIYDTGAYGSVMSSNYNSRGLPAEVLINESNLSIIHKPQTVEEFIDLDMIPSWLDTS